MIERQLGHLAELERHRSAIEECDLRAIFSDQLKIERTAPRTTEGAIKKTRFTEEQMDTLLREADQRAVPRSRRSTV